MGHNNPFKSIDPLKAVGDLGEFTEGLVKTFTGIQNQKDKAENRVNRMKDAVRRERETELRRIQKEKDDAMMTEKDRIRRNRTIFSSRKNRRRQGFGYGGGPLLKGMGGMLRKKLGSD